MHDMDAGLLHKPELYYSPGAGAHYPFKSDQGVPSTIDMMLDFLNLFPHL